MAKFFINRPIVAIVIAIITVIIGGVSMLSLPIAQFPNIVPPEIQIQTTYVGADALTVEQSVAAPIEQQMSGVDMMNYMYSVNANDGSMTLRVNFDVSTDSNTDQILAQMRVSQAQSQLPSDVNSFGVTTKKSTSSPLVIYALTSPGGTYDGAFLANYATININDALLRVPGIGMAQVFGASDYAMRIWLNPDQLTKLNITVTEVLDAIKAQNTVNPAGKIGGEPIPAGQQFTFAVRAQGRLITAEDFGDVIVRANVDGSTVRVRDVGRIVLGTMNFDQISRMNKKPTALIGLYQIPGTNAIDAVNGTNKVMEEMRKSFPADLEYAKVLDTTLAVTEGVNEIVHTLFEALVLVIIVVFIFLQGWRATLIPLIAVPVSLVGTFAFFPIFGFSINTLSLFGLVLAIGLVVDDAIVVVEAVEHNIEKGMTAKEATEKAMEEVSGPVVAIALILAAVFIPTVFIPGITGSLYVQFAVTIAISVIISAFNALTLSPALAAMLLKPKSKSSGLLGRFFDGFNRWFGRITGRYGATCGFLIHKMSISVIFLVAVVALTAFTGKRIPTSFLPEEDQGYFFAQLALPDASSRQRTDQASKQIEEILLSTPGVEYVSAVVGRNLITNITNTYSTLYFVSLKPWSERKSEEEKLPSIFASLRKRFADLEVGNAFAFPPPAIPGVGTSGGFTMTIQDRGGNTVDYLATNVTRFMEAIRKRPEIGFVATDMLPNVPQMFVDVDREKVMKQGIDITALYKTLQAFMGSTMVNYFTRFGRQWKVYIQAEGDYRKEPQDIGKYYVRNSKGDMVPLSSVMSVKRVTGPEFTLRHNLYRSTQVNGSAAPGYSSAQAMAALEEVAAEVLPPDMGYGYLGMSYQEKQAQQGVSPTLIFAMSFVFVFLLLAALYESWSLPFSVLLSTPIAVLGAFAAIMARSFENNVYAQIGLVMLIGLAAKNAILIVEFAKIEHDKGRSLFDAALEGAKVRLRPILMTSFAFILGCVPLAIASGSGSASRQVLGTVVIGGMLASTCLAVFIIPAAFYLIEKLSGNRIDQSEGYKTESDHG